MHARAHLRALTCLFAGERLSSDPTQGRGSMLSAPPPIRSVEVGSLEQVDLSIYLSIHRSICLSVPPHQSQAADLLYTYTHKHTQTHIHTHTHTHTHTPTHPHHQPQAAQMYQRTILQHHHYNHHHHQQQQLHEQEQTAKKKSQKS